MGGLVFVCMCVEYIVFASIKNFSIRFWNPFDSVVFVVYPPTILAPITSVAFYISQIFSFSARNTKHHIYQCYVLQHTFCFV